MTFQGNLQQGFERESFALPLKMQYFSKKFSLNRITYENSTKFKFTPLREFFRGFQTEEGYIVNDECIVTFQLPQFLLKHQRYLAFPLITFGHLIEFLQSINSSFV